MKTGSFDIPENWNEIAPYVIVEQDEVIRYMLTAPKCFFYDACAFWNHTCISNPSPVFDYIKSQQGIVILTQMILMELCSGNQKLWEEHIVYIKRMKQYGITVLIIEEEDVFAVLNTCYSGVAQVNQMLSDAVKYARSKMGPIETVLQQNPTLRREVLLNHECRDGSMVHRFFAKVRGSKIPGDNMGEELLAVCLHMLANIPGVNTYKYIVLTDDYVAIKHFGKVKENVEKHMGKVCISGMTTAKLCWLLVQKGNVSEESCIKEIIAAGRNDETIRVYTSEEYELSPSEKRMTIDTFAEKLIRDTGMKVYL